MIKALHFALRSYINYVGRSKLRRSVVAPQRSTHVAANLIWCGFEFYFSRV